MSLDSQVHTEADLTAIQAHIAYRRRRDAEFKIPKTSTNCSRCGGTLYLDETDVVCRNCAARRSVAQTKRDYKKGELKNLGDGAKIIKITIVGECGHSFETSMYSNVKYCPECSRQRKKAGHKARYDERIIYLAKPGVVKKRAAELKLTQEKISEHIGVASKVIWLYHSRKHAVPESRVKALCEILQLTEGELFDVGKKKDLRKK